MPPGSLNLDPILDQKMLFFTPVFRPGLQNTYPFLDLAFKKLCHNHFDKNSNKKRFLKIYFEFAYFSFALPHFGIERINTFIHSRSSLKNHTRFQTKKSIPVFWSKRRKNHTLWGGTYLYSLNNGVHLPPGDNRQNEAFRQIGSGSNITDPSKVFST